MLVIGPRKGEGKGKGGGKGKGKGKIGKGAASNVLPQPLPFQAPMRPGLPMPGMPHMFPGGLPMLGMPRYPGPFPGAVPGMPMPHPMALRPPMAPMAPMAPPAMARMPLEHQKQQLGERLYAQNCRLRPDLAGKLTGMMIEPLEEMGLGLGLMKPCPLFGHVWTLFFFFFCVSSCRLETIDCSESASLTELDAQTLCMLSNSFFRQLDTFVLNDPTRLRLPNAEILSLLESDEKLKDKIEEAVKILEQQKK